MRLDLELFRASSSWEFGGTAAFEAWIADRPWQRSTQRLGVMRVRPTLVSAALREAPHIMRRAASRSGAALDPLSYRAKKPGVRAGLDLMLGIPQGATAKEVVAQIARDHGERCVGLVVALDPAAFEARVAQEAVDALQDLADVSAIGRVRLCILVLTCAPVSVTWDCWVGCPRGELLDDPWAHENEIWWRYLHLRSAWHFGGDWDRAVASRDYFEDVRPGDDEWLEAIMNEDADERLAALGGTVRAALRGWVDGERADEAGLTESGLLWRPPSRSRPQITAWAARAMLAADLSSESRSKLRNAVICEPLQRALLPVVFEAEWDLREYLSRHSALSGTTADPASSADHPSHRFLPEAARRLRSDRAWDYLALGEVIRTVGETLPSMLKYKPLAELRNALAHGHPVGWQAVCDLRKAMAQIRQGVG